MSNGSSSNFLQVPGEGSTNYNDNHFTTNCNNNANQNNINNNNINNSQYKRKFSIPASIGGMLLTPEAGGAALSARRRLSNVSDAVSRKLSTTIGLNWRGSSVLSRDIIEQGKYLCSQYIRSRLKRSGLFTRKLGLQRLRSVVGTPSGGVVRHVFPILSAIGVELERMHPRLYSNVLRQASSRSLSDNHHSITSVSADHSSVISAHSDVTGGAGTRRDLHMIPPALLGTVARGLFRTGITWAKVVSLYSVCGGMAVDCVLQQHPELLPQIIECHAEVVEMELCVWIAANGGWSGLNNKYQRTDDREFFAIKDIFSISVAVVAVIMLIYVAIITVSSIPFY